MTTLLKCFNFTQLKRGKKVRFDKKSNQYDGVRRNHKLLMFGTHTSAWALFCVSLKKYPLHFYPSSHSLVLPNPHH